MNNVFNSISSEPWLSPEEFGSRFDVAWEQLSERFFKFESLSYYDEGDSGPFHAFASGKVEDFADSLVRIRLEDWPFYKSAAKRGAKFVRIHAIARPLTKYLEYEFYSYSINELFGEDIRVVDLDSAEEALGGQLQDFVLFDHSDSYLQDYQEGRLQGARRMSSPEAIATVDGLCTKLLTLSRSYREEFHPDPSIEALIRSRLPRELSARPLV